MRYYFCTRCFKRVSCVSMGLVRRCVNCEKQATCEPDPFFLGATICDECAKKTIHKDSSSDRDY